MQQQPGHLWSSGSSRARACVCVHLYTSACVCVCLSASRQCVRPCIPANTDSYSGCVWPASQWEPRRMLQAAAMSEAEAYGCILGVCWGITFTGCYKKTHRHTAHTHTLTHNFFCLCRSKIRHTRKYFTHRRPPLHEYSFATVMSCDMLSWQGPGTTWPGC